MQILSKLARSRSNEIVIISGRDKGFLEKNLGHLSLNLAAEHGHFIKENGKDWVPLFNVESNWKEKLRPLLERICEETEGSLLEEKEQSMAWHYRNVEEGAAGTQLKKIQSSFKGLALNEDLVIMHGNKVCEFKSKSVHKGLVVKHWLDKQHWDFIMAIGDDVTDEFMFEALPERAFSFKVGKGSTHARYRITSVEEVKDMLYRLTASDRKVLI